MVPLETDFDPSQSVSAVAGRILAGLHAQIIIHEAGAVAGDVEAIHGMRVGIRRMRVAISNFSYCLDAEERRRARAEIESLAGSLGQVRDLDVMIESIQSALSQRPPEDREHIASLIRRLERRRARHLAKLRQFLAGEEYAGFKSRVFKIANDTAGEPHG